MLTNVPAQIELRVPDRIVALHAMSADPVGLEFLVGSVDGRSAFEAILRPAELARNACLAPRRCCRTAPTTR